MWPIINLAVQFALIKEHLGFFLSYFCSLESKRTCAWEGETLLECQEQFHANKDAQCSARRYSRNVSELALRPWISFLRKCILWPELTLISPSSHVDHYPAGTQSWRLCQTLIKYFTGQNSKFCFRKLPDGSLDYARRMCFVHFLFPSLKVSRCESEVRSWSAKRESVRTTSTQMKPGNTAFQHVGSKKHLEITYRT